MITSVHNATVRLARALKDRKGRTTQGRYLAEGVRLISDLLGQSVVPDTVFFDEEALQKTAEGHALLRDLDRLAPVTSIYAVTPEVLASLSDTVHPAGVVVTILVPAPAIPTSFSAGRPLAVLLDAVQDPGNAGSILRSAAASGVIAGIMSRRETVDLFAPKVVRAAMGAHSRLPLSNGANEAQIAAWVQVYPRVLVASANAATTIYDVDWSKPSLIILGNEAHGPRMEALAALNAQTISIPMPGQSESLNVAAAAAIFFFEAARHIFPALKI